MSNDFMSVEQLASFMQSLFVISVKLFT